MFVDLGTRLVVLSLLGVQWTKNMNYNSSRCRGYHALWAGLYLCHRSHRSMHVTVITTFFDWPTIIKTKGVADTIPLMSAIGGVGTSLAWALRHWHPVKAYSRSRGAPHVKAETNMSSCSLVTFCAPFFLDFLFGVFHYSPGMLQ